MAKRLVVVAGPDEGRIFPLTSETMLLGRSRATDTNLIDPHVSRVHCEIQQRNGQCTLVDFESPGGTFVNGTRIVQQQALRPGDLIRIGGTHLQLVEDEGVPPVGVTVAPVVTPPADPTVDYVPPTKAPVPRKTKPAALRPGDWAKTLVGKTFSHYELTSILARGKSGFVFHARDSKRKLPTVVKILDPLFSNNPKKVQRFLKAMKIAMPLRHPHLLKIYGAGRAEGYCWVAKEYIPGESLAAVIGRIEVAGLLDWRRVAHVAFNIGKALLFAHNRKVLHLNVTPQNILLGHTVHDTKLSDLMLATAILDDPTVPISAAGVPSEALAYMPPERTDGPGNPVDVRADVYSLGATIYAMLTGRPPFQAGAVDDLVQKIRLEAPPTFSSLAVEVPAQLETIIRRMLAKRPQDRYESMQPFLKDLQAFAKSQGG